MIKIPLLVETMTVLLLLGCPISASTLFLAFDDISLSGSPSSSLTFSGILQNTTGSDVFLNGASGDLAYAELTFDPTPFFVFVPLILADGDIYTGDLFSIAISDIAIGGSYFGSFFILGGGDSSTFDQVAEADFEVDVSAVPELGAIQYSLIGLLGFLGAYVCRLRLRHHGRP